MNQNTKPYFTTLVVCVRDSDGKFLCLDESPGVTSPYFSDNILKAKRCGLFWKEGEPLHEPEYYIGGNIAVMDAIEGTHMEFVEVLVSVGEKQRGPTQTRVVPWSFEKT